MPVNSAVCVPSENETVATRAATVEAKGWAYSGGGRDIIRVDVTTDHGKTWKEASLIEDLKQEEGKAWAWKRWRVQVPISDANKQREEMEICSRAVDSAYNVQPESAESIWNPRGVLATNWHCVKFKVHQQQKQ